MSIDLPLTPQLENLVRRQLDTGRFHDAAEVVAAGLRMLDERSRSQDAAPDFAFGLWKGRAPDGLTYERALRAEWDR